jgi:hypothetical protein
MLTLFLPVTINLVTSSRFLNGFHINIKFCAFYYLYSNFADEVILGHISTFYGNFKAEFASNSSKYL